MVIKQQVNMNNLILNSKLSMKEQHSGKQLFTKNNHSPHKKWYLLFFPSANQEQFGLQLLSGKRLLFFSEPHIHVL